MKRPIDTWNCPKIYELSGFMLEDRSIMFIDFCPPEHYISTGKTPLPVLVLNSARFVLDSVLTRSGLPLHLDFGSWS